MPPVPAFEYNTLKRLCDVLADAATTSELIRLLAHLGIEDAPEAGSKPRRLLAALSARQKQDRCGNNVVAFVQAAMQPVRFVSSADRFENLRVSVNEALLFAGLELGEDGRVRQATRARTIDETLERASRLRAELLRRNVHPDVLRFCRPELLKENYFHAVLEATKSVAEKLRAKASLTSDGAALVDAAMGPSNALLAFNTLRTDSERSEHPLCQCK